MSNTSMEPVTAEVVEINGSTPLDLPTAFKGYDRDAVQRYVMTLEQRIGELNSALKTAKVESNQLRELNEHMKQTYTEMTAKANALREERDELRHRAENPLETVGRQAQEFLNSGRAEGQRLVAQAQEQAQKIIEAGRQEAAHITQSAGQEASVELNEAREQAKQLTDSAKQTAAEAAQAADERVKNAKEHADRLTRDAREQAQRMVSEAQGKRDDALKQYDATIAQLRQIDELLRQALR